MNKFLFQKFFSLDQEGITEQEIYQMDHSSGDEVFKAYLNYVLEDSYIIDNIHEFDGISPTIEILCDIYKSTYKINNICL